VRGRPSSRMEWRWTLNFRRLLVQQWLEISTGPFWNVCLHILRYSASPVGYGSSSQSVGVNAVSIYPISCATLRKPCLGPDRRVLGTKMLAEAYAKMKKWQVSECERRKAFDRPLCLQRDAYAYAVVALSHI
jgi:hypothetical protein